VIGRILNYCDYQILRFFVSLLGILIFKPCHFAAH